LLQFSSDSSAKTRPVSGLQVAKLYSN